MGSGHRLKIGLFGPNCSSGAHYVTNVPERWPASWTDSLRLARLAESVGFDFLLPIGRWKGFGGESGYEDASFETLTWAAGLLASTERITVFGTVHTPLFHPMIAAKQIITADHIGQGRFALNVICGWNDGEFAMFGIHGHEHDELYAQGKEWLDVVKMTWQQRDFDYDGTYFQFAGVRELPPPYGGSRPLIMNAGSSALGREFALTNCDALVTSPRYRAQTTDELDVEESLAAVNAAKAQALAAGRNVDVYTIGGVICRPTRAEAREYHQYCLDEHADWAAVDYMIGARSRAGKSTVDEAARRRQARGFAGMPLIGNPDEVADAMASISRAGFRGVAISFVNYGLEMPYFCEHVLPRLVRLGVRSA